MVGCVLVVMFSFELGSSLSESQTIDEGVHLMAGYSYWVKRDFRMNPEHPPLVKLAASFPLLFLPLEFHEQSAAWISGDQWSFAREFLYKNTVDGEILLQMGRMTPIFLTLLLGGVIFSLSSRMFGKKAGLLSLVIYAFDPLFLGHGHYVTTDVGLALFLLVAVFLWGTYLQKKDSNFFVLAALFTGLALATKFSAVILFPIFIILFFIHRWQEKEKFSVRNFFFLFTALFCIAFFVVWIFYGLEFSWYGFLPVIAPSFWKGFAFVQNHNATGHYAYLLGNFRTAGWWYYFPVTFILKTPLASLLLIALSVLYILRRFFDQGQWLGFESPTIRKRILHFFSALPFSLYLCIVPPLVYLLWSMTSHINLGVRHLSPMYPFLYIVVGSLAGMRFRTRQWLWNGVLIGISFCLIVVSVFSYPYFTAYFSEIAGGSSQGYRYLMDSNLDWGQGLKSMKSYIDEHRIEKKDIYFAFLGSVDPRFYGIQWQSFPKEASRGDMSQLPAGVYFLALSYPLTGDLSYQWFLAHEPTAKIGYVIYVYDLRR